MGSGAASPNRWILVDLEQDALPSEPERCLPPLVVGGARKGSKGKGIKHLKVLASMAIKHLKAINLITVS